MTMAAFPFLLFLLTLQGSGIPDLKLSLSFRESVAGVLQKPVYVLEVLCEEGECSFTYVSINDCRPTATGQAAFYPKVEAGSTRQGNLKVTNQAATLTLEQTGTDSVGEWTNTFRIGYEPAANGSAATRVTSFTGGFVKTSELVRRPATIEYVALPAAFQLSTPECAILTPGVGPN